MNRGRSPYWEYHDGERLHIVTVTGNIRVCDSHYVNVDAQYQYGVGEYPVLDPYCRNCVRKVVGVE